MGQNLFLLDLFLGSWRCDALWWEIFWSSSKLFVYIDRVESKSNPADGRSRLDFSLMRHLQAQWVRTCFYSTFFLVRGAVMPFTSQSHHRCEHNHPQHREEKEAHNFFNIGKTKVVRCLASVVAGHVAHAMSRLSCYMDAKDRG